MHVRVRMFDRCEPPLDLIYQQHSRGYRHDYEAGFHLLDVDVSGLSWGPKPLLPGIGYFAGQYHRSGWQLGRMLNTPHEEVVARRLFAGNVQLFKPCSLW